MTWPVFAWRWVFTQVYINRCPHQMRWHFVISVFPKQPDTADLPDLSNICNVSLSLDKINFWRKAWQWRGRGWGSEHYLLQGCTGITWYWSVRMWAVIAHTHDIDFLWTGSQIPDHQGFPTQFLVFSDVPLGCCGNIADDQLAFGCFKCHFKAKGKWNPVISIIHFYNVWF